MHFFFLLMLNLPLNLQRIFLPEKNPQQTVPKWHSNLKLIHINSENGQIRYSSNRLFGVSNSV